MTAKKAKLTKRQRAAALKAILARRFAEELRGERQFRDAYHKASAKQHACFDRAELAYNKALERLG